jgi:hypothetical protein
MNDFTKEELEQIKYLIFGKHTSPTDLCIKLQAMIDNYPEKPKRTLADLHKSEI